MTLTGVALRNLFHRPLRSALSVLGVALAIAAYIALVGLVQGIEGTLVDGYATRGADIAMTEAGAEDLLSSVVPDSMAETAATIPGIAATAAELGRMTTMNSDRTVYVLGWSPESFGWSSVEFVQGRMPTPADATGDVAGGLAMGISLADRLGLTLGDRVELFAMPFEITGLYDTRGLILRNGAIGLLSDIQAQTYRDGQATTIVIQLEPNLSVGARDGVLAALRATFPTLSVDPTETLVGEYLNLRIARVLAWSVSTVAIISAALAVLNTMAMAVNERRGEIAIMGAIGWPRGRIIACLLLEGVVLTLIGSVQGIAIGIAAAWGIAAAPAVAGFVEPVIQAPTLIRALILAVGIGLIGTLGPAWRAAGRDPAAILRGH